ncbi:transcription factor LBX1a [Echeneis naucrates]|uniref:transcription factor LBX1a n=1 Tax=Echeneis naucrates TaxID=173247 RepID=UPI0011133A97|nr:transcription factor LBX1-like [Echeneis naucrates]
MTTKEASPADRGLSRLDQLPPPANSNKPLTPFSIEDILSKAPIRRGGGLSGAARPLSPRDRLPSAGYSLSASPLCALEELASKTFRGLEVSVLQAAEGRDGLSLFGHRNVPKKRRKSRTAFTNHQIYELEKRFLYQKYLSPADRDQVSQQLGLTNAQVITWFQNRRAKFKRDLEEMKADVESAKAAGAVDLGTVKSKLPGSTEPDHTPGTGGLDSSRPHVSPFSREPDRPSSRFCSEDEEIDVDD